MVTRDIVYLVFEHFFFATMLYPCAHVMYQFIITAIIAWIL